MKKYLLFVFSILLLINHLRAQNSLKKNKELLYRFTMGMGIGSDPSQETKYGIGLMTEFAVQKKNNIYSLGVRRIEEFEIFGGGYPTISNNCLDITYGKALTIEPIFSSISVGLGCLKGIRQGKYLYGGGWLDRGHYENIQYYTVTFPMSAKIFWIPRKSHGLIKGLNGGIGIEIFANFNSKQNFRGINLCTQFGKLRPSIKH
jgi:hypothetical protein